MFKKVVSNTATIVNYETFSNALILYKNIYQLLTYWYQTLFSISTVKVSDYQIGHVKHHMNCKF